MCVFVGEGLIEMGMWVGGPWGELANLSEAHKSSPLEWWKYVDIKRRWDEEQQETTVESMRCRFMIPKIHQWLRMVHSHTISKKPNIHVSVNNQFLSQNPSYPFYRLLLVNIKPPRHTLHVTVTATFFLLTTIMPPIINQLYKTSTSSLQISSLHYPNFLLNMLPDYVQEEALFFPPSHCCLRNSYSVSLFSFSFSPIHTFYLAALAIAQVF